MELPAILAIIGGIALLVGILGGGVEAKEIKIPSMSRQARNVSTVLGLVLIGTAIFTYIFKPSSLQAGPTTPLASSTTIIASQIPVVSPIVSTNQVATVTQVKESPTSISTSSVKWELVYKSPKLARSGMAASYDSYRHVIVLFGGEGQNESTNNTLLAETLEYDGNSWYQVNTPTTPSPRKWFGMAYDVQRRVVVVFGGNQDQSLLNDTWEYDGKDWKLIQTAISPPPLSEFGFVYDTCKHKIVMFGGRSEATRFYRSTWEYDGSNWEELNTIISPPARSLFSMAFDSNRCRAVLFGGEEENFKATNDTWEYDGNNWSQKNTDESPSPRWAHSMVFDPIHGKIVLFGGYGPHWPDGNTLQDTWEYDGTRWVDEHPNLPPSSREQHILAFDGNNYLIVLFGGIVDDGDTWKLMEK
jgi:hypothetical protein